MLLEVRYLLVLFSGMFVMILGLVCCSNVFYRDVEFESEKKDREKFIQSNTISKVSLSTIEAIEVVHTAIRNDNAFIVCDYICISIFISLLSPFLFF